MAFVPRPYFYRFTAQQFQAHVRACSYRDLVQLRDLLEETCASCERVRTAGAALDMNTARMGFVDAELGARANAALRADLRDRRQRTG
jgi:hypothetical protein